MMRRRWAVAAVLAAALLLLHLLGPGGGPDAGTAARAVAAADAATPDDAPAAGTEAAGTEAAGQPCPCAEDTSVRHSAARSPRTAGAAGSGHAVPGGPARADVVDRGGTDLRRAGAAERPGTGDVTRSAPALQTFRC
ncbi:hypothetical protein [Streptomyces glaucus]